MTKGHAQACNVGNCRTVHLPAPGDYLALTGKFFCIASFIAADFAFAFVQAAHMRQRWVAISDEKYGCNTEAKKGRFKEVLASIDSRERPYIHVMCIQTEAAGNR